jgi:hypothetical protein
VSDILRERFEAKQFYTAEEVAEACDECRAPDDVRQYAVAMFVEPAQAQGVLEKLGASRTALELRKFLATQIFVLHRPDVSFGNVMNGFHAAGDPGEGPSHSCGDGADGCSDGGGDGGGDGGD